MKKCNRGKPAPDPSAREELKILSIGQSHSQDSVWLVQEVLRHQQPNQKFLVAECLLSVTLVDHLQNARNDAPLYNYYVNTEGNWDKTKEVTIRSALKNQKWDYIVINESSRMLGLESVMRQGYVPEMAKWVRSVVGDEPILLYNWTWTTPTDQTFHAPTYEPLAPANFWNNYTRDYQADRKVHYEAMREMLVKYVEPVEEIDGILYCATPIQYATEVLGVPQVDMYRDYIHLSDYGRLFIGYLWYAQIYGLEEITQVNVDAIPAHLRQWRWVSRGDVSLTPEMKENLIKSVNYALKNPMNIPE